MSDDGFFDKIASSRANHATKHTNNPFGELLRKGHNLDTSSADIAINGGSCSDGEPALGDEFTEMEINDETAQPGDFIDCIHVSAILHTTDD
jgi:hypothetical protein